MYDEGSFQIWWRKNRFVNRWSWENWLFGGKKEVDTHLTPHTKINFKYTKLLKYQKNESIKILEENKTEYLYNLEGRKVPLRCYFKGWNHAGSAELYKATMTQRNRYTTEGTEGEQNLSRRPAGSVCPQMIQNSQALTWSFDFWGFIKEMMRLWSTYTHQSLNYSCL